MFLFLHHLFEIIWRTSSIALWNDCTKPSEMIHHVPMFSSLDDLAAVLFRAIFTMQYRYKPATIEWIECWKKQRKEGKKGVMQHISSSSYIDSPPPFFFPLHDLFYMHSSIAFISLAVYSFLFILQATSSKYFHLEPSRWGIRDNHRAQKKKKWKRERNTCKIMQSRYILSVSLVDLSDVHVITVEQ